MSQINVNNGQHIASIMLSTVCETHNAPEGTACYELVPGSSSKKRALVGVCGARIKSAGYDGKINPTSLKAKASSSRARGSKR